MISLLTITGILTLGTAPNFFASAAIPRVMEVRVAAGIFTSDDGCEAMAGSSLILASATSTPPGSVSAAPPAPGEVMPC